MFDLTRQNRKKYTIILIIINIFIYFIVNVGMGDDGVILFSEYNVRVIYLKEYYRIFTAIFIHANIVHLTMNMVYLLFFGVYLEDFYGPLKMIIVFIISGIFANIMSLIFLPLNAISLGASGAIFGLIGASYIGLAEVDRRMLVYAIGGPLILVALSMGMNVNSWAHLFGALMGILIGYIYMKINRRKIRNEERGRDGHGHRHGYLSGAYIRNNKGNEGDDMDYMDDEDIPDY
ncbi:MAG: rhomboid family intramembrane serine protease [Promethearchaeota archaeon]